jgi:23S rRNA pseudouridine1911/1915/1917 synthase
MAPALKSGVKPAEAAAGRDGGPRRFEVAAGRSGCRLDRVLVDELGLSRAAVRRLLERGAVRLGAVPTAGELESELLARRDKGRLVVAGNVLWVAEAAAPADEEALPSPGLELVVLAAGSGWLAADKPAGVAVHPLRVDESGTLLGAVAALHPGIHGVGEAGLRSGVVHRIDMGTSGVVLFALDQTSWQRLRAAFSGHLIEKTYHAIVHGELSQPFSQKVGLTVARHRPARVRVVDPLDGADPNAAPPRSGIRTVEQDVRPLRALRGATLVEVRPRTGFLHQIRATLAHIGHPLLGDVRYGAPPGLAADRHLLHALALRFEDIDARAPYPLDFEAVLEELALG